MATPQYGSMTFVGQSGRTYTKDVYLSDVAGALVRFDSGGAGAGAATPDNWRCPEPCTLMDFAIVTGTADTTKIQIIRDSIPTGSILRYVPHLTTNALRPGLRVPFGAGQVVTAIQLA